MTWKMLVRRSRLEGAGMAIRDGIITIVLNPDVVDMLGVAKGERVEVFLGDGEHAGQLKLCKGPSGYKVQRMSSKSPQLFVRLRAFPGCVKTDQSRIPVACSQQGSIVFLTLPPWARSAAVQAMPVRRSS
jgi:hypothetical protein